MQLHGPKRVYTQDSLEFWFGKLELEWDGYFAAEHLESGRELYRTGGIREVGLTATDAIIHCRVDKKDEYSVLEWGPGGLVVRSSSANEALAQTIAVAGLHEIEELVADEIPILPIETPAPAHGSPTTPSANGHGHAPVPPTVAGSNGHAASEPRPAPGKAPAAPVARPGSLAAGSTVPPPARPADASGKTRRDLLLKLSVSAGGLVCEPWWSEGGKARHRAHQPTARPAGASGTVPLSGKTALGGATNGHANGHANGGASVPAPSATERMKLISLTALARKSHFRFHPELGAYVLEQVAEIPHFLKGTLPIWAKSFKIEQEPAVAKLAAGVQTVRIEARVRRGAGNAIDLEWIFRTGEQLISAAQVRAITEAHGGPVVLPDVGLVALAPDSLKSLRQWTDATATFKQGKVPAYLLFSLFNDRRFELTVSPELEQWRQGLLGANPGSYDLPEFLRPYQCRGVEWLAHLADHGCHGLLADEMGLGKTVQIIALLRARPVLGKSHLVVCPASVVPVWIEELRRFAPEMHVFVLKNGVDFAHETRTGVWLASYAQLRNHRALLDTFEFGYAILDEGQFIKNPDAKVTNTCFAIQARHRIVLTGTPLENRQLDLWSIFHYLLPGLFGTRTDFETALLNEREATMDKLRRQLEPFILRRTKAQVATELPPKVEVDVHCPLTELQRSEYARVCREGLDRLGDDINRAMREKAFGFLSLLTRLRQICCDPDLLPWLNAEPSASGKLQVLVERLAEVVSSGHKVVIFSQFVMFLRRVEEVLAQQFPDVQRFELTGATLDRQRPVQEFQQSEGAAFMLVSLKAAGTGITLHSADYVFLLDPWWNPSVEEQAIDRVHRIGQTRTVFVYRMVTQGTIEERITALKAEKKQLFRRIIEGMSGDVDLGEHFKSLRQLIELAAEPVEIVESVDVVDTSTGTQG
jgi:hypothetical protein